MSNALRTARSRRRTWFPGATIGQWLLAPALGAIILSTWLRDRAEPPNGWRKSAICCLGNQKPLVASLRAGALRVVDAVSGREIYEGAIPPRRGVAPEEAAESQATSPLISQWRWPWTPGIGPELSGDSGNMLTLRFTEDDATLVVSQVIAGGERFYTLVHLPTGKQFEWMAADRGYPLDFVVVGRFLVVIDDGTDSRFERDEKVGATGELRTRQWRQWRATLIFDPVTGAKDISNQDLISAVRKYGEARKRENGDDRPEWVSDLRLPRYYFVDSESGLPSSYCNLTNRAFDWRFGEGRRIVEFCEPGDVVTARKLCHWLVDETNKTWTRCNWPFAPESQFIEEAPVDDEPAVVGNLWSPIAEGLGEKAEWRYWNLETGQTASLIDRPKEICQYGDLLLAEVEQGVEAIDLKRGRRNWVVNFDRFGPQPRGAWFGGWLLAWLAFVRPTRAGDCSRRLGAVVCGLSYAALYLPSFCVETWDSGWNEAGWLAVITVLLMLQGSVAGATIWRTASPALLVVVWPVTLLLLASVAVEGEIPHDDPQNWSVSTTLPQGASLRMQAWDTWFNPHSISNIAPPSETPWERIQTLLSGAVKEEPVVVKKLTDLDEEE